MNELSHPWSRVAGVVLTAGIIFLLDTGDPGVVHRLLLPLGLAVAAWLMTRSLMAVAFATFTMAAINTSFSAPSWIPSIGYPLIAATALLICTIIIVTRFRERIAATHDERWARRRARSGAPGSGAPGDEPDTTSTAPPTDPGQGHTH